MRSTKSHSRDNELLLDVNAASGGEINRGTGDIALMEESTNDGKERYRDTAVVEAIAFLREKHVLGRDRFAEDEFMLLRYPSSAIKIHYWEHCQARLVRLHNAVLDETHETNCEMPPTGVQRFDIVEFPDYADARTTLWMVRNPATLVQRVQRGSGLCCMHACVVMQHYAISLTLAMANTSDGEHRSYKPEVVLLVMTTESPQATVLLVLVVGIPL